MHCLVPDQSHVDAILDLSAASSTNQTPSTIDTTRHPLCCCAMEALCLCTLLAHQRASPPACSRHPRNTAQSTNTCRPWAVALQKTRSLGACTVAGLRCNSQRGCSHASSWLIQHVTAWKEDDLPCSSALLACTKPEFERCLFAAKSWLFWWRESKCQTKFMA